MRQQRVGLLAATILCLLVEQLPHPFVHLLFDGGHDDRVSVRIHLWLHHRPTLVGRIVRVLDRRLALLFPNLFLRVLVLRVLGPTALSPHQRDQLIIVRIVTVGRHRRARWSLRTSAKLRTAPSCLKALVRAVITNAKRLPR